MPDNTNRSKLLSALIVMVGCLILIVSADFSLEIFDRATNSDSISAFLDKTSHTKDNDEENNIQQDNTEDISETPQPQEPVVNTIAPNDITANYSASKMTSLNRFLTSLPQSNITEFTVGDDLDVEQIINCAYIYNVKNNPSRIRKNGNTYSISSNSIVNTVNMLFGVDLEPQTTGIYTYSDKKFHISDDINPISCVAQTVNILDNNDGTFLADFKVYNYDEDDFSSEFYRPEENWSNTSKLEYSHTATATFRETKNSDKKWSIIAYSLKN